MRYSNSHKTMWNIRYKQLCEMSYDKYNDEPGEIDLLAAIIINEAQYLQDREFFNSNAFEVICKYMLIDSEIVRRVMLHTMHVAENNIYWDHKEETTRSRISEIEEDDYDEEEEPWES